MSINAKLKKTIQEEVAKLLSEWSPTRTGRNPLAAWAERDSSPGTSRTPLGNATAKAPLNVEPAGTAGYEDPELQMSVPLPSGKTYKHNPVNAGFTDRPRGFPVGIEDEEAQMSRSIGRPHLTREQLTKVVQEVMNSLGEGAVPTGDQTIGDKGKDDPKVIGKDKKGKKAKDVEDTSPGDTPQNAHAEERSQTIEEGCPGDSDAGVCLPGQGSGGGGVSKRPATDPKTPKDDTHDKPTPGKDTTEKKNEQKEPSNDQWYQNSLFESLTKKWTK